jgi:hypothetical protein
LARITEEEKQRILELCTEGKSIATIAKETGRSQSSIRKVIDGANGTHPKQAVGRESKPTAWDRICGVTGHQVVGGLVVLVVAYLASVAWEAVSEPKSVVKEMTQSFLEVRTIQKDFRPILTELSREFYLNNKEFREKYPNGLVDPLVVPDKSWVEGFAFTPLDDVNIVWSESKCAIDPVAYHMSIFPFTRKHGYSRDVFGFARSIEELNAPNGRFDVDGDKVPGEENVVYEAWHKEAAARDKRKVFNGRMFGVADVSLREGNLSLTIANADYYDFTDSCESMAFESASLYQDDLREVNASVQMSKLDALKKERRETVLRARNWDVFDYGNRVVGVGLSILFIRVERVDGRPPTITFYMHDRTVGTAAEAMGTLHVVPAGGLVPVKANEITGVGDARQLLRDTMIREFLDELLDEVVDSKLRSTPLKIDECSNCAAYICKKLKIGAWKAYFCGLGMDPLNTKLEMGACLVAVGAPKDSLFVKIDSYGDSKKEGGLMNVPFTKKSLEHYIDRPNILPVARMLLMWAHRNYDGIVEIANGRQPQGSRRKEPS